MLVSFFKKKTSYDMLIISRSSDVCSSDLRTVGPVSRPIPLPLPELRGHRRACMAPRGIRDRLVARGRAARRQEEAARREDACADREGTRTLLAHARDRQSVVQGKRVSERLDPGVPLIQQKKKQTTN